jgi:hypothetical protein
MRQIVELISTHWGQSIAVYVLGYFITLYICFVHWREAIKNDRKGFWGDGPETHNVGPMLIPFFWPLFVVLTLPIIVLIQFYKLIFHLGVNGDLTPRLAAITRRANR